MHLLLGHQQLICMTSWGSKSNRKRKWNFGICTKFFVCGSVQDRYLSALLLSGSYASPTPHHTLATLLAHTLLTLVLTFPPGINLVHVDDLCRLNCCCIILLFVKFSECWSLASWRYAVSKRRKLTGKTFKLLILLKESDFIHHSILTLNIVVIFIVYQYPTWFVNDGMITHGRHISRSV